MNKNNIKIFYKRGNGMSLAEVIIASAVVLLIFVILVQANLIYYNSAVSAEKSIKATLLLEAGIEEINYLSQVDWANLANSSSTIIDNYTRSYNLENVNRDDNDNIVLSGGSLDAKTKQVIMTVSWLESGKNVTKSISSYIMKP
jgi:Tfp pilus assembly protein PilV